MRKTILIQKQPVTLDPAQLIQSGGEGMVFQVGQTAVKLYHQPQPQHQQKLDFLFQSGLNRQLPPEILAPTALVTDQHGRLLGFQMPLLPSGAVASKHLSKAAFWQKNGLTTTAVLTLFQQLHATLSKLHTLGVIVGDLNDQNIFISLPPATLPPCHFLLDVDSYQFGRFPCPVAMDTFVDPNLYGIADLSQRPFFSPATDWYAYFVLLVRSLLHVHPYGGVHHQHKSITARAAAGLSILQPDVTYPASARPHQYLPDSLLHHLHRVFDLGERPPFPVQLLIDYANSLAACAHCGQQYPQERQRCPTCAHKPQPQTPAGLAAEPKRLFTCTDGFIDSIHVLPNGRFLAILYSQEQYRLVRFGLGGVLDEMALFNGRAGYQFAAFQHILAVNPPESKQLLLLDVGGSQPRKVALLETAVFQETAVFAASPHHLVRIAGDWIMRGSVQNGHFVEDPLATAHRRQTWFCASPVDDTIAGYHRIFAEYRFFLWCGGNAFDVAIPPLPPGESLAETAVAFTQDSVIFTLKINQRGKERTAVYHTTHHGKITHQTDHAAGPSSAAIQLLQGNLSHTIQEIWYHPH
ncbi:MAG: hypothetical protein R6X34_25460 [Chloroflexota bacterium]